MNQSVNYETGVGYQFMNNSGMEVPQHYYPVYQVQDYQQNPYQGIQPLAQGYYQPYQYDQSQMTNDMHLMQKWFDYKNEKWIKGAVVGAVATLLFTNTTVQKTIAKGVLGVWGTLQSGVEEFKEQIRDVQAETHEE